MKFYNDNGTYFDPSTDAHILAMENALDRVKLSHASLLQDKHITGNIGLYLIATTKPKIKLSKIQYMLVDGIKTLFCIEGESITLEKVLHYNRFSRGGDLETFDLLLVGLCLKYTSKTLYPEHTEYEESTLCG